MEHVVFFPGPAGEPAFERLSSLEDALRLVERLRNVDGVAEASVHALTEVPLSFRAYYRVEVPAPAAPTAVPTPEPVATEPIATEPADEPVVVQRVTLELVVDEPADEPVAVEPVADEPVAVEPVADAVEAPAEPAADAPLAEAPVTEVPVAGLVPVARVEPEPVEQPAGSNGHRDEGPRSLGYFVQRDA
ncbi:MAG: hypothetical protein ACJ74O_12230 [Frankiaceae bacterium]